ncbi:hypothetical protein [Modicisalibacter tunisiensis]|uniref:Uncharacterized protein n=1 Tax=Modicisalibacter tunisiensis TaxID=390637 RepID=A0ABS7WW13_9GAMM|nr:hypothetical protein [Modicisalibacter tunisiensis]MBZ9566438.1 hypothetical protein [Modicisalibacter tunisiensis]
MADVMSIPINPLPDWLNPNNDGPLRDAVIMVVMLQYQASRPRPRDYLIYRPFTHGSRGRPSTLAGRSPDSYNALLKGLNARIAADRHPYTMDIALS